MRAFTLLILFAAATLALAQGAPGSAERQLFTAIVNRDVAQAEKLLGGGVDIHARNEDGETPLHRAAEYGLVSFCR